MHRYRCWTKKPQSENTTLKSATTAVRLDRLDWLLAMERNELTNRERENVAMRRGPGYHALYVQQVAVGNMVHRAACNPREDFKCRPAGAA